MVVLLVLSLRGQLEGLGFLNFCSMSLENEDGNSADKGLEAFHESQRPKISYTREFLLSLSELDICKKLPSGFDRSVLGEFEDTSHGIQDRPRSHGSLPLQGFRRNDYSSSPPTRGDAGNYSRGVFGRWDNRSSGWNDKESDSQSVIDSDSGRRYGNQSRRPWQNSEHDGLLGSGSFPRPAGFAAGATGPKVQANDHNQLNRSTEPYHPPRPFKAVPHARSNVTDSLNDETFGSSECTSQDRAEEERRRRASFELMRKEQQKVLQEKHKLNTNKHKSDGLSDLSVLVEEPKEDKGLFETNNELDSGIVAVSDNDSGKSQGSTSRPLVPPGFRSTVLEKSSGQKTLISFHEKEVPKPEGEEIRLHAKAKPVQNGTLDNQGDRQSATEMDLSEKHLEDKNIHIPNPNWGIDMANSSSKLEVPTEKLALDNHLYRISGLSEVNETVDDGEVIELMTKKLIGEKNNTVSNSTRESSTSILEKLFGGASTVNTGGSSGFIEHHDSKPDEIWSPSNSRSSKFAQWFNDDEKKLMDDLSSGRPNDLLSLIVGGEKVGSQVSTTKATELMPPEFSCESSEITNRITASIPSAATETSEQFYNSSKDAIPSAPVVLTCEDLEQTILSEYSEKSSISQPVVQDWTISAPDTQHTKAVDSNASHHLLSLLQKGTGFEAMTPSTNVDIGSLEKPLVSEVGGANILLDMPKQANAENIHNSGQSLTLETLFGTAFMKELQSVDAPVSVQRGSAGSARTDITEPHGLSDDGSFSSTVDVVGPNRRIHESNVLASNQKQPTKSDKIENWLRFDDPRIEVDSLQFQSEVVPRRTGFDGAVEIQLPEEESLITLGDSMNQHKPMFGNSYPREFLLPNGPVDIAEKLAALKSGFRGERSMAAQEGHPFGRGPFDLLEPDRQYQNLHAQPSPPHIHGPQTSHHRRTLFHSSDPHPAHINSQMRFPEHVGQHDAPPNHQFPASMLRPPFHHPDTRVTGFDLPTHQQMLQQMQMPGNFPPPHLLREFPRGSPLPPHPSHQATNLTQEDTLQGFPFSHRQPNIGGLGMPLPAPDAGGNHPEAFQRLMEMELRAKSKQIHPFGVGHSQGMHGHELDMGFRYR